MNIHEYSEYLDYFFDTLVKHSNLLICFLVVNIKHMLGVCLAGAWRAVGRRSGMEGVCERGQVSVSLKLLDTEWFLVRKVGPYYGKYKGILATDNMVQLLAHIEYRQSGNATFSERDLCGLAKSRPNLEIL
jgi:hypothetical protein